MPQNFRTRTLSLHQDLVEAAGQIPRHHAPGQDRGFGLAIGGYSVVDLRLADTVVEGVLLLGDDMIVLPEDCPSPQEAEEILEISATPAERIPDFTITEPDVLWEQGSDGTRFIEHGNSIRLDLFGPEEPETVWRDEPVEACHLEALEDDEIVSCYDGEFPASCHGPCVKRFERGGIRLSGSGGSAEKRYETVLRPRGIRLWVELLDMTMPEIDESFTLRELMMLLDVPGPVGRDILMATYPTLYLESVQDVARRWLDATEESLAAERWDGFDPDARDDAPEPEPHVIEVSCHAYLDETLDAYSIRMDASAVAVIPEGMPNAEMWGGAGDTTNFSLSYPPHRWLDLPIRFNPTLIFEDDHKAIMRHLRGPYRAWRRGGGIGDAPTSPERFRTKLSVTIGEFIGAILGEIGRPH